eukprot:g4369.t1
MPVSLLSSPSRWLGSRSPPPRVLVGFAVAAVLFASPALSKKQRAITKIVKLLEKMESQYGEARCQLEQDQDEDDDAKTKMDCWCKNNAVEKTEAVKGVEAEIRQLNSEIAAQGAEAARRKLSLEELEKDLAAVAGELLQAEERREKEQEENQKAILELTESVTQINAAIVVLKNAKSASAGTRAGAMLMKLKSKVVQSGQQKLLSADVQEKLFGTTTSTTAAALLLLQQSPLDTATVTGMLTEMQTTFEQNLQETTAGEAQAVAAYLQLRQDRNAQADRMRQQRTTKHEAMARAHEAEAEAKLSLVDAEAMLDSLDGWISEARKICKDSDEMYGLRTKERSEERKALAEATELLDRLNSLFRPIYNQSKDARLLSLVQQGTTSGRSNSKTQQVDPAAGSSSQPPAASRTSGALASVIQRIDGLIMDLKSENREELNEKNRCQASMHANELEDQRLANEIEKKEVGIQLLGAKQETLLKDEEETKEQKKQQKKDMEKAEKNFEAETADLQVQIADQIAVQKLLVKALATLQGFYDKKEAHDAIAEEMMGDVEQGAGTTSSAAGAADEPGETDESASFVQVFSAAAGESRRLNKRQPKNEPPPVRFEAYETHDHHFGVLQMLENVKNEASTAQAQLQSSLDKVVEAFDTLKQDHENSMLAISTTLAELESQAAETKKDLVAENEELKNLKGEQFSLSETMFGERKICIPVIENFDRNQETRTREAEALKEAIAILRGADIDSGEFAEKVLGNR